MVAAQRNHFRIWQAAFKTPQNQPLWVGAGTHDIGIETRSAFGQCHHAQDRSGRGQRARLYWRNFAAGRSGGGHVVHDARQSHQVDQDGHGRRNQVRRSRAGDRAEGGREVDCRSFADRDKSRPLAEFIRIRTLAKPEKTLLCMSEKEASALQRRLQKDKALKPRGET